MHSFLNFRGNCLKDKVAFFMPCPVNPPSPKNWQLTELKRKGALNLLLHFSFLSTDKSIMMYRWVIQVWCDRDRGGKWRCLWQPAAP